MRCYTIKGKLEKITMSNSQPTKIIRNRIKKKDQKKIFEKNEERIVTKRK
jgi:hypothetical protein